ncbi:MAG: MFS transporter [Candidatus Thermoplasmatota archaeon]|jgi:MFS family permease|nr:MFS transporter [Candidatus Thermoplasmatota archaeon]
MPEGNSIGISSVMISRLFYALNWYNISPALLPISQSFNVPFSYSGFALSSFLLGAGIFQLPAGIVSSRIGARRTALMGLYLMAAAAIISASSANFIELVGLRFLVGVGAAFYFSTAISILNEIAPERIAGMIGYYNASFNIGAGAGIIAFTPLIPIFGWRMDFLVSGIAVLVSAIFLQLAIRRGAIYGGFDSRNIRSRLLDRRTWVLGVGLVGLWSVNYTLPEYFKSYGFLININPNIAGLMGGIIPIAGIVGGVISGTIRHYNPIKLAALLTLIIGMLVMGLSFIPYLGLWFVLIAVGLVATIVISLEYAIVALMDKDSRYMALNIGLINTIQIGIGSAVPAIFGFVEIYGFSYSWMFLGAFSIATLAFLLMFPRNSLRFFGK